VPPLSNTPSCRGAQLKHRDNLTITSTFKPWSYHEVFCSTRSPRSQSSSIWFGCKVPGTILLRDIVETCLRMFQLAPFNGFNALTPVVWKLSWRR